VVRLEMADTFPPGSRAQAGLAASAERDRLLKEQIKKDRAEFDAKTAKLKALRLAKEAADQVATPPKLPKPKGRTPR
jgi:hypothetical protein